MDERLVIDASVAVKWFLRDTHETEIAKADAILDSLMNGDVAVHVPEIFKSEVCGALTKACAHRLTGTRTPRLTRELALSSIRDLFKLPLSVHRTTEQDAVEAADLAINYGKGLYDMAYLKLALNLDCRWCTSDAKFLRAVPASFPKERVVLLSMLEVQ